MDVRMPDGTLIKNVPEGITKAQLMEKLNRQRAPITEDQLRAAGAVPGIAITPEQEKIIRAGGKITPREPRLKGGEFREFEPPQPGTQGESFTSGMKRGAQAIGGGIVKGFAHLTGNEGLKEDIEHTTTLEEAKNKAVAKDYPLTNLGGQIAGEIAVTPLLGPVGKTRTARIATGTTSGALAGALSGAGRNQDAINSALIGAGFGAGFTALSEAGQALALKIANAKAGNFTSDDIAEVIKLGEQHNIPVFADDVTKSPIAQKVGVAAENIPIVGTLKGRTTQNQAQQVAAEKIVNDFSDGLEDFAVTAQKGLINKLGSLKKIRRGMFDRVSKQLDPLGEVDLSKFKSTIQQQIDEELAQGTLADKGLVEMLTAFRDAPTGNFTATRRIREKLGNKISDFYSGKDSALGSDGVQRLQAAKDAMEENIKDWVSSVGGDKGKKLYRQALDFSRDRITIPFRKTAIKKLVDTDQPEKIVAMLKSGATQATKGRKSFAVQVWNALDPKGRQAVQAEILTQAFNKATEGRKAFSANTFAGELEKIQNITGTFFRAKDRTRLNGLVKLMRATGRAGQVAENPPTGARLLIPGAAAFISPKLVISAAAFGAGTKTLFQTKTGRNLLVALGKTAPNTPTFGRLVARAQDLIGRVATRSAITTSNQ